MTTLQYLAKLVIQAVNEKHPLDVNSSYTNATVTLQEIDRAYCCCGTLLLLAGDTLYLLDTHAIHKQEVETVEFNSKDAAAYAFDFLSRILSILYSNLAPQTKVRRMLRILDLESSFTCCRKHALIKLGNAVVHDYGTISFVTDNLIFVLPYHQCKLTVKHTGEASLNVRGLVSTIITLVLF